jgi:ubiquinone/menaquinone biosynthesis C-methylase UbiE
VIAHDNLEEFQSPADYDLEELPRSLARIAFHVDLARRVGGPALELACGSGIVALPLARAGLDVTGVDLAAPMLRHAQAKAEAEGLQQRTAWLHADAKRVRVPGGEQRFPYVFITGNAFQAFLTEADQLALLATARQHLRSGGLFCFETRNPGGHELRDIDEEQSWDSFVNTEGHRVTVTGTQHWEAARELMHWTTYRRWHDATAPRCRVTRIACRFTTLPRLDALLRRAGFGLVERHGNWDHSPLGEHSEHIISVCR